MSAQDNTEKIIRKIHRVISEGDPYPRDPSRVIIQKKDVLVLLDELTAALQELSEEYQLSIEAREKVERDLRRKNEAAIADTARRAEDIYAASMLYSTDALERVWEIMHEATDSMSQIYEEMEGKLRHQEKKLRNNQSELQSQLQDMKDTDKYMSLIEDHNKEEEREKNRAKAKARERKKQANMYANRQTEIRVNREVLNQLGFAAEEDPAGEGVFEAKPKKEAPVIRVNEKYNPNNRPELGRKKKVQPEEELPVFAASIKELKPEELISLDELDDIPDLAEVPETASAALEENDFLDDEADVFDDIPEEELMLPEERREAAEQDKKKSFWRRN